MIPTSLTAIGLDLARPSVTRQGPRMTKPNRPADFRVAGQRAVTLLDVPGWQLRPLREGERHRPVARRPAAEFQLAPGFTRHPVEELGQRAILDVDIGRHRLRPGPLLTGGVEILPRDVAVAIDQHLGAGIDGGLSLVAVPLDTALAHAQPRAALADRERELSAEMPELTRAGDGDETARRARTRRDVDVHVAAVQADGVTGNHLHFRAAGQPQVSAALQGEQRAATGLQVLVRVHAVARIHR